LCKSLPKEYGVVGLSQRKVYLYTQEVKKKNASLLVGRCGGRRTDVRNSRKGVGLLFQGINERQQELNEADEDNNCCWEVFLFSKGGVTNYHHRWVGLLVVWWLSIRYVGNFIRNSSTLCSELKTSSSA
jgi:hypothetical protein